ncbi:MAG: hypothetical protein ACR2KM_06645 [Gemmatimonadaceae bacterium]
MKRIAIEVMSGCLLLAGMALILSWDQLIDRRSRARRARAELAARREAWPVIAADVPDFASWNHSEG